MGVIFSFAVEKQKECEREAVGAVLASHCEELESKMKEKAALSKKLADLKRAKLQCSLECFACSN